MTDPNLFTYKMRKETRKIHAVSDALVNAKLAMALNSDAVWAEGLLIFYEIFKFLEEVMSQEKYKNLNKLLIKGLPRAEAFEQDLTYYYGKDWEKSYQIRESVAGYLTHLNHLLNTEPDLLIAYIYHLYMGMLSGAQILRKKRELQRKMFLTGDKSAGEKVTDFGEIEISDLKTKLRNAINSMAETFDEEKKLRIIAEGNRVFELNNIIIRTVGNVNEVLFWRALGMVLLLAFCVIIYKRLIF